ncbi:MAG: MFS transporter [Gammaproteobacteria bacterium]|nr:MFS transporter [Gammaproteobacteria bacterium]
MTSHSTRNYLPWVIWLLGALFFLAEYFVRISPSVITQNLMSTFHVSAFTLGGLSGFFYYAYISMQIPVGVLVDRFNSKRLLIGANLVCAISCLLFAGMHNIEIGFLSRFLMGLGAAFAFVGTLKLISLWFPPKRFALLAGCTQALGMLGAVIGDAPMSMVFSHFGWRQAMYGISGIFILLALLMLFFIPKKHPFSPAALESSPIKVWPSLATVLSNPQTWLNCLFIGLLYAPTACFGELWGVNFISSSQDISTTQAAAEVGFIFIGMAIGCPLLGFLSDRQGKRLMIMRLSCIICFIVMGFIIYHTLLSTRHISASVFSLAFFIYGLANSGIVPSYALSSEINPHKLTGIALGVTNMASVLIGAIFIPLVGWILDTLWNGTVLNGARVFTLHDYQIAFILLPLCFVLALISSAFLNETFCQSTE